MGTESFETKIKNHIKESIGDLITDDDLKVLIVRALEEVFFEEKSVTMDSWGYKEIQPPLMHEIVKDVLKNTVEEYVSDWIKNHPGDVLHQIELVLQKGMGIAVVEAVTSIFSVDLEGFKMNIENRLRGL